MNGCMPTDRPLISILMAVYEPRMDWLREQLASLEAQTYPYLRLYILDDGSRTVSPDEIRACVSECIRSFPVVVEENGANCGSNAAFEALTRQAEGDYFAYCDQDDVWLPEKLEKLYETIVRQDAELVCSDMTVIDADGNTVAPSITRLRRHHLFRSGEDLWRTLWYSNFASGCAMLVRASAARSAVPFNPHMVYDHYIALCCSERGRVVSVPEALIRHREHGGNQSSLLKGVEDKQSYYRIRVEEKYKAVCWLCDNHVGPPELMDELRRARKWMEARLRYSRGERRFAGEIWRQRRFSPRPALFELAMPYMPEKIFDAVLSLARDNRI